MRDLTYEFDTKNTVLETYEWDNTWIEFANDKFANRILYIGDSISGDTRYYLNELLNDNALVDRFGTSKALDNPYFFESLKVYTKQLPKIDAILFNNGLHGWHLNDDSEYPAHYEKMLEFLIKEYNNSGLLGLYLSFFVKNSIIGKKFFSVLSTKRISHLRFRSFDNGLLFPRLFFILLFWWSIHSAKAVLLNEHFAKISNNRFSFLCIRFTDVTKVSISSDIE